MAELSKLKININGAEQVVDVKDAAAREALALKADKIETKEYPIASTTSGINPSTTDSADGLIQDLTVYGKSRTSKNLAPLPTKGAYDSESGAYRADLEDDYVYSLCSVQPNTQYTAFVENIGSNAMFIVYFNGTPGTSTYISSAVYTYNTATITTPTGCTCLVIETGRSSTPETVGHVQLELGSTPTPYEPYFSGIHGIGEDGEVNVVTCGKNLMNPALFEDNKYQNYSSTDHTITDSTTYWITGKQKVVPGQTYKISLNGAPFNAYGVIYGANERILYNVSSFTAQEGDESFCFNCNKSNVAYSSNLQLELGTTATTYEPYVSTTAEVTTGIPLYAVGDAKDELDEKRGVVIKRCGKVLLTENEYWWLNPDDPVVHNSKSIMAPYLSITPASNISQYQAVGICDKLTYNSQYNVINGGEYGVSLVGTRADIRINGITTVEDLKTYLASNPVTVVYELAEPYEIPLTASELSQLRNLRTYASDTNITVTDNPTSTVDYLLNTANGQAVADVQNELQEQINDAETDLESGLALKTDLSVIAEPYDSTKTYSNGDIFEYNGELWQVIYAQFMNVDTFRGIEKVKVGSIFKRIQITTSDQLPVELIPGNSFVFTTDDNEKIWLNTISITNPVLRTDNKYFVEVFRTFVKATSFRQYGVILAKNDLTGIDNIEDANNILKIQKINDEYVVTYANSSMSQWTGPGQSSYSITNISKGTSPIGYVRGYAVFINDDNTETIMYTPCKLLSWEDN